MVKVFAGPGQSTPLFVKVGVTIIVAVTGAVPPLVAVNIPMGPLPETASPMPGTLLVQE